MIGYPLAFTKVNEKVISDVFRCQQPHLPLNAERHATFALNVNSSGRISCKQPESQKRKYLHGALFKDVRAA